MPSVFSRAWRYLKALISGKLDQWEDPDVLITEAIREARENQIKNRELAVQAITQKNNLQAEVDKLERAVAEYERKAALALQGGNRELAKQFLKEKALQDQTLESMRGNLVHATESAEKVKVAIKQEEERIRVKTAEAMALKTNLKQAQIQIKINKALDQFQFSENEQGWSNAKERIQSMQSEANARAEIAGTSMDSKMREMEMQQVDLDADRQLEELEQKIALNGNPASQYTKTSTQQYQTLGGGSPASIGSNGASAPESDIDRQLRELEERLGKK